eukprot:441502-Prymnesium_polylepis.1
MEHAEAAAAAAALRFPAAGPSEVLVASHKDTAYSEELAKQLFAAASATFGSQWAHARKRELAAWAGLLYFGLTTGRGRQTPGEEYSDLTVVRASDELPAERARRWAWIALRVAAPYALQR